MSIYKDLNDVKLDLSEFEEIPLSEYEQKRILKKALKRIQPKKQKKNWLAVSAAVVAVCMISIVLTVDNQNNANLSEGDSIEINQNDSISSYKMNVTKENTLGKLTLNEIQIDYRKIALKATFEPVDFGKSNDWSNIHPKIKVNGKEYLPSSEQTGLINDSKFRIYSEFELSKEIKSEKINIEIIYDYRETYYDMSEGLEDPWIYNVQVSQKRLLEETEVFEINKTITLENGGVVSIEKVVSTPLSTTVYFDLSQSKSTDITFEIQSKDGSQKTPDYTSITNGKGRLSFNRFEEFPISNNKYFLIPKNSNNDESLSEPIPIN